MAHNQPIDARSDLFSLGVSIYETLIGERIYTGDLNTPPEKIYAQAVPPLASKRPDLPRDFQGVLDRALAIDPDDRFHDAEVFAMALRQVAATHRLLYSAPEFAAELREIMGPSPETWLTDPRDQSRNARLEQAQDMLSGKPDSLVEPGSAIENTAEDEELENIPTPPARPSGAMSAVRSSAQLPKTPAPPPAEPVPSPAIRTFEHIPASVPATNEPPAPEAPLSQPGRLRFPAAYLARQMGGVAAFRRSRRRTWLLIMVVLAALMGFAFVRFFLQPTPEGPSHVQLAPTVAPAPIAHPTPS
jgi:serine/threonine protein kinase